jgi:hypothetical protein
MEPEPEPEPEPREPEPREPEPEPQPQLELTLVPEDSEERADKSEPAAEAGEASVDVAGESEPEPGVSLYDSTFSRTVWRLYGGVKGLLM